MGSACGLSRAFLATRKTIRFVQKSVFKNAHDRLDAVVQACNPNCSVGRDWEDCILKPP
jgi:hypothetical protein